MNDAELVAELESKYNPAADKLAEGIPRNVDFWWKLVHLDPAILKGAVVSIIGLLATLGLLVNDQTQGAILTSIASIIALVQALWTRKSVTPNIKVVVYKPDPVNSPRLLASGPAISTDVVAVSNAAADDENENRELHLLPFPEKVAG